MSKHLGDFAEDAIVDFKWSTNGANGASITRATNGTVSVYIGNGTTQVTAGVTDTEDFDSLTGIHHCRIDLSADAAYVTGSECQVVLSGATIDGQTVNAVLAEFSIERAGGALALLKGANGVAAIKAETALIVADTNELQTDWANGGRLDLILDARASQASVDDLPTNAELATALAAADDAVLAQVALVKAATDNLPSDPADQSLIVAATDAIMARLGAPAGASIAADIASRASQDAVDDLTSGIIFGAAATGTLSTTQATSNLTGYADDQVIGRVLIWLSGACEGEATYITDYASASGLLTFTALTTAPGNGDTFKIV